MEDTVAGGGGVNNVGQTNDESGGGSGDGEGAHIDCGDGEGAHIDHRDDSDKTGSGDGCGEMKDEPTAVADTCHKQAETLDCAGSLEENVDMSVDESCDGDTTKGNSPSIKRLPSESMDSPNAKRPTPDRLDDVESKDSGEMVDGQSSGRMAEGSSSISKEVAYSDGDMSLSGDVADAPTGNDGEASSPIDRSPPDSAVPPDELSSLSSSSDSDNNDITINPTLARRRPKGLRRRKRDSSPPLDSDDDSDPDNSPSAGRRRRGAGSRRRGTDSSSSNHSLSEESDNVTASGESADRADDVDSEDVRRAVSAVMDKSMPKKNFFLLSEVMQREYGMFQKNIAHSVHSNFEPVSMYSVFQGNSVHFSRRLHASLDLVTRLRIIDQMKYHEGCVNTLSFNRTGTLLASGSDDLQVVLWNWQGRRPALIYESGHRSNVFQAKFMPYSGDCLVVSCARDGQVRLAELSLTGICKGTRKLANHIGTAHKLAIEPDSAHEFLSCGEDAVTFLLDLREEKPHRLAKTREGGSKIPLYSIASNPANSRQFCVGGRDHFVRVYDKRMIAEASANGGVLYKRCPSHLRDSEIKANVTCAVYNYNGEEILATYNDEDIYLFDNTMSDGADFTQRYTGHRNNATVKGVNFYGPKSEYVVSGSDCGNVFFWEKQSGAVVNFQSGDEAGVVNVLEPHPSIPVLATAGLDHDVKLWEPTPVGEDDGLDKDKLASVVRKNHADRLREAEAGPEMIGGQMLWFLMHHFRNSARRRMREEGINISSSDTPEGDNSDSDEANSEMQCAQS